MRWLLPLLCLALTSCVDVFRGAIVQVNLNAAATNAPGEHYELFAVIDGGVVPIERFKIFDSIADCAQDTEVDPTARQLVQRYDDGASREALCDDSRRLGNVTILSERLGGVRIETPIDLRDAERLLIAVEPDGETDPAPTHVLLAADMGDGVAPFASKTNECRARRCENFEPGTPLFESQGCDAPDAPLPRSRRGVRLGVLLRLPVDAFGCGNSAGEVAVVPASDETFL